MRPKRAFRRVRAGRVLAVSPDVYRLAFFALSVLAGGCAQYHAGDFSSLSLAFPGEQRTVGCVDVAASLTEDDQAVGPVVGYSLGNRCSHGAEVDLAAVRVRAVASDGHGVALAPYDPAAELRVATLEVGRVAREVIEYGVPSDAGELVGLCVDVSHLDRAAPSPTPVEACFALRGGPR
jgi:hypothetical protein